MKHLISFFFFTLPLWASFAQDDASAPIYGDLQIPDNYIEQKKSLQQRDQIIPMQATDATSPGGFSGKILEYHLTSIFNKDKFKPLESVKGLENAINKNTEVETSFFKIKSKLDVNRMRAEMDIETFINTKLWTEDSFNTLRAQMKLYEIHQGLLNNGLLSLENKTSRDDSRTYLNLIKTW